MAAKGHMRVRASELGLKVERRVQAPREKLGTPTPGSATACDYVILYYTILYYIILYYIILYYIILYYIRLYYTIGVQAPREKLGALTPGLLL